MLEAVAAATILALLVAILSNRVSPRVVPIVGAPTVQVARAALPGRMTTGFPVSPIPAAFRVAGLSGVDLGAHQRFSMPWLYGASLMMTSAALLLGVFSL